VTNTFTVGNVSITLDEAKVDEYGVKVENADRVIANDYKLIPGETYTKDPTIHVDEDSEDCWLVVHIENTISDVLVADTDESIASQLTKNGWTEVATGYYTYKEAVKANAEVPVFGSITVKDDATYDELKDLPEDAQINVTAYAIQSSGFDTAADAWKATFGAEKTENSGDTTVTTDNE
jgi:hypothetical protein